MYIITNNNIGIIISIRSKCQHCLPISISLSKSLHKYYFVPLIFLVWIFYYISLSLSLTLLLYFLSSLCLYFPLFSNLNLSLYNNTALPSVSPSPPLPQWCEVSNQTSSCEIRTDKGKKVCRAEISWALSLLEIFPLPIFPFPPTSYFPFSSVSFSTFPLFVIPLSLHFFLK